jgi:hypothetical protein
MTGQDRPQDPIPPQYQDQDAAQDSEGPAFQSYQQYPQGYVPYTPGGSQSYQPPAYYPQPQYQYYPPQGMPPPSNLGWAIAAILLFWPVGIAAIVKSTQVDRYWMTGQFAMAEQSSKAAKTLGIVAASVAGALFLIWLVMFFVLFGTVVDQIPAPPR